LSTPETVNEEALYLGTAESEHIEMYLKAIWFIREKGKEVKISSIAKLLNVKQPLTKSKKYVRTIIRIPDDLWNEITNILPHEKPENTIGRPIVPYRKVLDGILYVLRTGCQWKMLPKDYGSGSTCHRRFQEWIQLDIFDKLWTRLLKIYDKKRGIKWNWQSLDSISVKSPLGGR
jgi:transposase